MLEKKDLREMLQDLQYEMKNEQKVSIFQKYTAYIETFHYVISSDIKDLISELC